jgi:uncharacterized iron-regulated membrane protein
MFALHTVRYAQSPRLRWLDTHNLLGIVITLWMLPDMQIVSAVYPGYQYGSPYHYLLWAKGNTPLTSRLFSPSLVDARQMAQNAARKQRNHRITIE